MAVEFPRVVLPALPPSLRRLWFYLADRDVGPPSILATPEGLTTSTTSPEYDLLAWSYSEKQPPGAATFRKADGFLLAAAAGDVTDPWVTGAIFRVSIQSRAFVMPGWAPGTARSYALAAYRNTYQGEQATGWDQPDAWRAVGAGGAGACIPFCYKTATYDTGALAGASHTATGIIQAGWMVWGINAEVLTTITGATSWQLGLGLSPTLWGSGIALPAGTVTTQANWVSRTLPTLYPVAESPILTATGAPFTGGDVRLTVFYSDDFA